MVDILRMSNRYALTPLFHEKFMQDQGMQELCIKYVSKSKNESPDLSVVI